MVGMCTGVHIHELQRLRQEVSLWCVYVCVAVHMGEFQKLSQTFPLPRC